MPDTQSVILTNRILMEMDWCMDGSVRRVQGAVLHGSLEEGFLDKILESVTDGHTG